MISLNQAHKYLKTIHPPPPVRTTLDKALNQVCAEDVYAAANCPSVDSSLKDGFAVISADTVGASRNNPVTLAVIGVLSAGDDSDNFRVTSGTAVRIMTGAPIPSGATAVLASEFSKVKGELVTITADALEGRNILRKGRDIVLGQEVLRKGTLLGAAHLGLLAAAGLNEVSCYPLPKVAVVATGSELVWPGDPVLPGKVAASNMVIAAAELQALGINGSTVILHDSLDHLQEHFKRIVEEVDILITCGGVLDGDKDLTMKAMEQIGMEKIFHRIRIGPGKGACMGRVGDTVIFNLPGGPPSNHVALQLLALPGVRRLIGCENYLPRKDTVQVAGELSGQENWTQLVYSRVQSENGLLTAVPLSGVGRLEAMAIGNGLIEIPEGCVGINEGAQANAWLYNTIE